MTPGVTCDNARDRLKAGCSFFTAPHFEFLMKLDYTNILVQIIAMAKWLCLSTPVIHLVPGLIPCINFCSNKHSFQEKACVKDTYTQHGQELYGGKRLAQFCEVQNI